MADPTFDQLSASTLADLRADVVWDNFFVGGDGEDGMPILRTLRAVGALETFFGGLAMQEPTMYDRVQGGAIAPGSELTVVERQILAALDYFPKEYVEQIPLNLWQTNVINAGPAAKVKLVDLYMTNAVMAANTDINIDFYRHGQPSGTGVADNRSIYINGASEQCNDGVNPSWDGNYFPTIGGQARGTQTTGTQNVTLNSIPVWAGDASGNANGQAAYKTITELYLNCVRRPDTGVSNKAMFGYLLERQEVKQRFGDMPTNQRIGLTGIKFFDAFIHVDKLAPSTKYGQILPSGLSLTTSIKPSTFTMPNLTSAQTAISNFPTGGGQTINPGEVFFWFRLKGWKLRPSNDPEYNHNFTPPIRSQTNADLIVMFYKAALNWYTPSPRDNSEIVGIGS